MPAWSHVGLALLTVAWGATLKVLRWNREDRSARVYMGLLGAALCAIGGSAALLMGPWISGLSPTEHVYAATVWLLVIWVVLHVAVGVIMHGYCFFRRWMGQLTAKHDIDIHNVALYWHFTALSAAITTLVIAGFPLVV